MTEPLQATAIACANIAFIKYWGQQDTHLTLPTNGSISMNLDGCLTETSVYFAPELAVDRVFLALNGGEEEQATGRPYERVMAQVDRLRHLADVSWHGDIRSRNNFPSDAGIASSAAAFAALTKALVVALGLEYTDHELSRLTRLSGSGSACRSIPGGFVEWRNDGTDNGSYAVQLAPPGHWALADLVAVIDTRPKAVSSLHGHGGASSSAYFAARLSEVSQRLDTVRRAIVERDIERLGVATEADAISMHVVMMTQQPAAFYWQPGTLEVMHAVRRWREQDGLQAYCTTDAGPNVHVICEAPDASEVEARLDELASVQWIIANSPGPEARVIG